MKLEGDAVMILVGLTVGAPLPLKLPGSYPWSIGFNSDGFVYLDGIKLVFGSEKENWGKSEKVIGCGSNPRQKKVFFPVDSQLVHVINCKTKEFGTPLNFTVIFQRILQKHESCVLSPCLYSLAL
ncbi:hypothetical protein SLEP1_g55104 [Rubroshorea leprosula]|uniref:SPRY domain-containing protein n=1 Tax=Rubroshorea leprosula TaxID=152421 RepID=A0AAV5MII7_9ROSI|nr:hypothetical protein SLEP1_g55104 [Rubroshorea leprosula]